jgi:hypothetical protein
MIVIPRRTVLNVNWTTLWDLSDRLWSSCFDHELRRREHTEGRAYLYGYNPSGSHSTWDGVVLLEMRGSRAVEQPNRGRSDRHRPFEDMSARNPSAELGAHGA